MARKKTAKKKIIEPQAPVYIPPSDDDNPKYKAIDELKSAGYDVYNEDGSVMVLIEFKDIKKEMPKAVKEIERIISNVGYHGSFGCRAKRTENQ